MGKFDQRAQGCGLLVGPHDSVRRVEDLPLASIMPDPGNPRRAMDETGLKDLAGSMAARGVLQPILVTPRNRDGLHVIRIGERRFHAAKIAGRETIPAIVVAMVSPVDTLADQLVENDQRAALTPHDLATGIERLLRAGISQVEIARALGRSKQFVSLYAACADMAPWLRTAIDRMPVRLLYDLHRAARTHGDAVRAYLEATAGQDVTLARGSRFIAALRSGEVQPASNAQGSAMMADRQITTAREPGEPANGRIDLDATAGPQPPRELRMLGEVQVSVAGHRGRLVLPDQVRVKLDDGREILAPADRIVLH